jgi:hypothetical protein
VPFELWKHFQEAADARKEELFKLATWQIGLMAAVLAYAVKEGVGTTPSKAIHDDVIMLVGGVGGFLVAQLTLTAVFELGEHITRNCGYANKVLPAIRNLRAIVRPPKEEPQALPKPALRLLRIVRVFEMAFGIIILVAIVQVLFACYKAM